MNRAILAVLLPPSIALRQAQTSCCVALVTIFWSAALASLVYGYYGGPLALQGICWATVGLGLTLWAIAATWALSIAQGFELAGCRPRLSPWHNRLALHPDESDPFDELRKML